MKIVAVLGSPHGTEGSTGRLLAGVMESARSAGAEVTAHVLAGMKVQPCRGCAACHKTGECVMRDDFKQIKDSLLAADGVVLASPNYIFSVTAQMKAMMDRCSCPLHCQAMEGKYGASVVTSGGSGGEEVEGYLLRFLRALGCRTVGGVTAEARQLEEESSRGLKYGEAAMLGARLVEAIRTRAAFPDQDNEHAAFFQRMRELVSFRKDEWPYEFNYWKSHGRI